MNQYETSLQIIADEFQRVAVFPNNLKRLGTYQACFIDWLQGLPSCINIEYYTNEILKLMDSFGLPKPDNKTDQEGEYLFHYLIFTAVTDLCKRENIQLYK